MKVPFEPEYRKKYYRLLDELFDSNFLSEGMMVKRFEEQFSSFVGVGSVAVNSGGAGLLALLEYVGVAGGEVIVPSNTFMATPLAAKRAGADVVFADSNRTDLCLNFSDMKKKITSRTKAVVIVHMGGHIAFEIDEIVDLLRKKGIPLIEDCAHAHGAVYKGRQAGTFGIGGAYSFYATKTMPTGEGGMVVSKDQTLLEWIKKWRNYGKFEYKIEGMNARMNEVTAAFGLIQLERLPMMLAWKRALAEKYDQIFTKKVIFPEGMRSGYYKYIVFEPVKETTGLVFGEMCHDLMGVEAQLPNSDWIKDNHWCPPIYYGWDEAGKTIEELKEILCYD